MNFLSLIFCDSLIKIKKQFSNPKTIQLRFSRFRQEFFRVYV
ncbi:hypothetical protein LEP1GSC150_3367 [Leptospira interrogans serovar Copenhageni str. LT2050]|uniref:Uncharacterized protein n=1 Tax=Leptospira interrogans serovar Copenhageni str. LT2050 TaxID=1001598 RepID=M3IPX5_LEPIT|nr:hypothetical protein LEP1GSC150_3367 [Leptospira interrogans serovar Copenhageni str. LT2050]